MTAPPNRDDALHAVTSRYAAAITPTMSALLEAGDQANDPIARQFLPTLAELEEREDERADPIGDGVHSPLRGIVHRYPDRVLLTPLTVCPVYCRFCFRREVVGGPESQLLPQRELDAALDYIRLHPEIWEVILSGGDPLILSTRRLSEIILRLRDIEHVRVLRIHSRVPLVDPDRISDDLLTTLEGAAPLYVALHANHPREFTAAGRAAIARLVDRGIPLVSQSVLLRGVNDHVDTLAELMRVFVENRIKPYYLHHLDKAPGTGHFRVPLEEGQALVRALRGRVSGLCQPTYVVDIPGGHGKSPAESGWIEPAGEGAYTATDYLGGHHRFED